MYKTAEAYNQINWTRWAKLLPKWNVQSKWANNDERVLKVGDLVWLIDESVWRHENKMERVIEVFPGTDGIIRSTSMETTDGFPRRLALKLAPVFFECFQDENRATAVANRKREQFETN